MNTSLDKLRKEYVKFNENINTYNIEEMTRYIDTPVNYKLYNLVNELYKNNLKLDSNFDLYCENLFDNYRHTLENKFNITYWDAYKQVGHTSSNKLDNKTMFYINRNNQVVVGDDFIYDREKIDDYTLPIYIQEVKKMMDNIEKYAQSSEIDDDIENDIDMLLYSLDEFNNESLLELENLYDIQQFTDDSIEFADSFENYKEFYKDSISVEETKQDFER